LSKKGEITSISNIRSHINQAKPFTYVMLL